MRASRHWSQLAPPRLSGDVLLVVPGLLVAGVLLLLATSEGGVRQVDWYPATVFLIALLAVVVAGSAGALATTARPARLAVALLGAFAVFNYLSIAWAGDRGAAWDAANMTLLYFAAFTVFAVWPWSARSAMIVLSAYGLGLAAIGWVVLGDAASAADPTAYFIKLRFSEPVGYPNGDAALFLGAAFALVMLAARREMPWLLRGLALGSCGALVDLTLLSQSRGSLLAGAILIAVCVAAGPGRVRTLVALAAVGAMTWLSVGDLVDVFDVAEAGGDVGAALEVARDGLVLSFVTLFGLGASAGLVERHAEIPERVCRRIGRGIAVVAVIAGLAGTVVVVSAIGNPVSYAQSRWQAFTDSKPLTPQTPGTRLTASLDGRDRDEFWSVALHQLDGARLLGGMGAGNFAIAYARERRGFQEPADPHSLPVRILSQTGVIGAILFLGFLVAAAAGIWRARRSPDPLRRAVTTAALAAFAYWFVHASADWLYAIPAVAGPAFAWLGMAVALGCAPAPGAGPRVGLANGSAEPEGEPVPAPRRRTARRGVVVGAVFLCTAAMLAAVVPPWLAATAVDEAAVLWRTDANAAFARLDRARALNPLSDQPDTYAGVIASRLGERDRARRSFARAVKRTPTNWYTRQQLGIEDALAGNGPSALWQLRRARSLNPNEPTTITLIATVRSGRRPVPGEVRATLISRVCARVPTARGC